MIHFGGFVKFLKGISKKRVIDPEKYFKNEREILQELNESRLQGPIILVDPTYKYRNVCAGLSKETFEKFVVAGKKFLKTGSIKMFSREELDVEGLIKFAKKKKARFVEMDLKTDRQEGDIAGTKMKKFFGIILKELKKKGQKVLKKEFFYPGSGQAGKGYLIVKENKEIGVGGVPVKMKKAVKSFKRVRKKTYTKKGRVYAKEKVDVAEVLEGLRKVGEEIGVGFGY